MCGTTAPSRGIAATGLIFLAPDHGALARLRDCIRVALAWNSIVEDVAAMRLVLDNLQARTGQEGTARGGGRSAARRARVLQVAALPGAG